MIKPGSPDPGAWPYNQPTWVFSSRQLPGVAGADIRFDAGRPLLPRSITRPPLRLMSARAIGAGFAELRYEVPD